MNTQTAVTVAVASNVAVPWVVTGPGSVMNHEGGLMNLAAHGEILGAAKVAHVMIATLPLVIGNTSGVSNTAVSSIFPADGRVMIDAMTEITGPSGTTVNGRRIPTATAGGRIVTGINATSATVTKIAASRAGRTTTPGAVGGTGGGRKTTATGDPAAIRVAGGGLLVAETAGTRQQPAMGVLVNVIAGVPGRPPRPAPTRGPTTRCSNT